MGTMQILIDRNHKENIEASAQYALLSFDRTHHERHGTDAYTKKTVKLR
jgi:hypothetical protein